ncbi:hypothetical protein G5I_11138 [Acromyrmex echinatior]|uniref:Uncharacterized protein n=1 Tax=Acromyrmex echinatior TaxID=103372 RepID=F4WYS4_ACREC|nr:hypothetical protein G5I_11138 [Acromyrmex echinatior]
MQLEHSRCPRARLTTLAGQGKAPTTTTTIENSGDGGSEMAALISIRTITSAKPSFFASRTNVHAHHFSSARAAQMCANILANLTALSLYFVVYLANKAESSSCHVSAPSSSPIDSAEGLESPLNAVILPASPPVASRKPSGGLGVGRSRISN